MAAQGRELVRTPELSKPRSRGAAALVPWRHSRALALPVRPGVTREAWRWSLGLAVTWVGGARFTVWKPRAFLLGGCGQGSNSLLLVSWGGEKRGGAGEDGEGRGGPEGSSKAAVSAMRKTFRGGSPEDRWSSGSLTSWRRDSSGGGREHGEDGLAPPRGCFAPPRYRVRLEDLDELHRAAWQGDVPGVERVLAPGGPGVDERDKKQSIQQLISEYKEKQTPESLPQNNNPVLLDKHLHVISRSSSSETMPSSNFRKTECQNITRSDSDQ
ncbi:uncharacterized protein LOC101039176 [Saimiri boliviensis]|uniref:uncharacterized protein LOC101039176 n=1 Tax=Saimiri boliviensis TaxID=27679 RepID=UPI003D77A1F9